MLKPEENHMVNFCLKTNKSIVKDLVFFEPMPGYFICLATWLEAGEAATSSGEQRIVQTICDKVP